MDIHDEIDDLIEETTLENESNGFESNATKKRKGNKLLVFGRVFLSSHEKTIKSIYYECIKYGSKYLVIMNLVDTTIHHRLNYKRIASYLNSPPVKIV